MKIGYRSILFALVFLLPLTVIAIYQLRYATDRYHSEAIILVTEDQSTSQSLDLSTLGLPVVAGNKDALTLVTFVSSLDMTNFLEKKLQVRQHFSDPKIDWFTRFDPARPAEQFHDYLANYVWVEYDEVSQLITVHAESFDRQYSQDIVNAILARSQDFVDKLNAGITEEQMQFFEKQLQSSEVRLKEAKNELLKFQRENKLFSTDVEATMVNTNIGALEKLLLDKQGELNTRRSELNENSPVIQVLRAEINTIQQQLKQEKERLTGASTAAVSELDARFREIQFNIEFISNIYKSNLAQLEQARLEAVQRLKYLVVVTAPSLADASLYPDRVYIIGTTILILIMIYFVVSLLVAIVREHT